MSARPNILYIMSDQHARGVAGCYGDAVVRTPALDRLAAGGVSFDAAYCPSPICVPSRMSAFTGQWPSEQQCWTLQDHLASDRPTWMHALGAAGYRPVLVGRMHAVGPDQMHGFAERIGGDAGPHWPGVPRQDLGPLAGAQGPCAASLRLSGRGNSAYQTVDEETAAQASDWLARRGRSGAGGAPFCLMVGFLLPHCPFVANAPDFDSYRGRIGPPRLPRPAPEHAWLAQWRRDCGIENPPAADAIRARTAYYGLVTRLDRLVGDVLDALDRTGLRESTLVVYCSDHGEQIGERGHWWKNTFYEQSVGVPLILSWPGRLPQGARRPQVVNLTDVAATLIDAAAAPELPAAHGRSLLPVARDPGAAWRNRTFSEYVTDGTGGWTGPAPTCQRMVRDGDFKLVYIDGHDPMLFDLSADPDEMTDLAGNPRHAKTRARLEALVLDGWDPAAIRAAVARRADGRRILHAWAGATRPPLSHVRPLDPAESWVETPPAPQEGLLP
ncbi:sulfatase-like hydrolase/transferase [Rhodobacteraceae bacterium 2CG4]|uniref:Sulfatase-like hydrolase/transferase n=1 Tax=Halovulum marinum TaxID=2662447 RepID=A0A6L5Z426_9RHOB|nr:sulfatase-like hydrolase/transferase [Halovulum marinum]MSU90772.1 sulfatase-like hydrolase/transferase [Halovulum marinum]